MMKFKVLLLSAYAWLIAQLFGAIAFNTLVFYPNIFYDIPHSLEQTMAFLQVRGPHHFFPPLGSLVMLLNAFCLLAWWRQASVRYPLMLSLLLLLLFEFVFSLTYFWDRNTIMFIEGVQQHSEAFLHQTAVEFQRAHWLRVGASATASLAAFRALWAAFRNLRPVESPLSSVRP